MPLLISDTFTASLARLTGNEQKAVKTTAEARGAVFTYALMKPGESIADKAMELALSHPDAHCRFRVMASSAELQRALDAPWEKWAVFLHPAEEQVVMRRLSGPARLAGLTGTGKTIVALHRAYSLAPQNPTARVLLTTVRAKCATDPPLVSAWSRGSLAPHWSGRTGFADRRSPGVRSQVR
jgi:hypothetical protein